MNALWRTHTTNSCDKEEEDELGLNAFAGFLLWM
jgi:hypothetical protein